MIYVAFMMLRVASCSQCAEFLLLRVCMFVFDSHFCCMYVLVCCFSVVVCCCMLLDVACMVLHVAVMLMCPFVLWYLGLCVIYFAICCLRSHSAISSL